MKQLKKEIKVMVTLTKHKTQHRTCDQNAYFVY